MSAAKDFLVLLSGVTGVLVHSAIPPEPPVRVCVLLDRPGVTPQFDHSDGMVEMPRVQVVCRGANWDEAHTDAEAAWLSLNRHNFMIDGTRYMAVKPLSSVADLGMDENRRRLVGFNAQVWRQR